MITSHAPFSKPLPSTVLLSVSLVLTTQVPNRDEILARSMYQNVLCCLGGITVHCYVCVTHILLIHSPIDAPLGCFPVWAIMKSAAVDVHRQSICLKLYFISFPQDLLGLSLLPVPSEFWLGRHREIQSSHSWHDVMQSKLMVLVSSHWPLWFGINKQLLWPLMGWMAVSNQ